MKKPKLSITSKYSAGDSVFWIDQNVVQEGKVMGIVEVDTFERSVKLEVYQDFGELCINVKMWEHNLLPSVEALKEYVFPTKTKSETE